MSEDDLHDLGTTLEDILGSDLAYECYPIHAMEATLLNIRQVLFQGMGRYGFVPEPPPRMPMGGPPMYPGGYESHFGGYSPPSFGGIPPPGYGRGYGGPSFGMNPTAPFDESSPPPGHGGRHGSPRFGNPYPRATSQPGSPPPGAGSSYRSAPPRPFQTEQEEMKDLYAILGVSRTATKEDLEKAKKDLNMKYHPNRVQQAGGSEEEIKKANEKTAEINEALNVLMDDRKRKFYDDTGEMPDEIRMMAWEEMQQRGGRFGGRGMGKGSRFGGGGYAGGNGGFGGYGGPSMGGHGRW